MPARAGDGVEQSCWSLVPGDPDWPPLWREMPLPPAAVHGRGRRACLTRPALAIVGTRGATARGLAVARGLAADLARAGWIIVSGLARGIDTAAHEGALDAGAETIAVMGTGLDRTYPPGNRRLRARIEAQGCVVSEYAWGTSPEEANFAHRNRLVAGLASGVLVVEAPLGSGALLTAQIGLELDREVMAVPGPIDLRQARGCHRLLKAGATLVEGVADVHGALVPPLIARADAAAVSGTRAAAPVAAAGGPARWLWDRIDLEGVALDELRAQWRADAGAFAEALLALEMARLIRRLPGGRVARKIWIP